MKSKFVLAILMVVAISVLAACGATPAQEPTVAPTEAPTAAPTESPTETPMAAATEAPTETPQAGGEVDVMMINITFQPEEITIQAGTTVVWTNDDALPHTVTSGTRDNPSGLFDSGNVGQGQTFRFTFEEPGTYDYFCRIHPGMNGTVIVQ